jgi:hypothetical protein
LVVEELKWGKQLGFVLAHNRHSQGSKGRFTPTRGKDNITPHGGWGRKGCVGRKDVGSPVLPTTNTPEKRHAKEEQGSW